MPTPPSHSPSLPESYQLWLTADDKWDAVNKTYALIHGATDTFVLQAFYEDVLTPEERAAWDKWVSGGTATPEEWAQIQAHQATDNNPPNTPTPNTPSYAWIIIEDLDNGHDDDTDLDLPNRVGVAGPRDATPNLIQEALDTGKFFRLLDDDGHPYYVGKIWTDGTDDDDLFGPLRDYGTPDVGATTIEYRNHETKQWEAL